MRKLFMGTLITSLLGALVVGAALAWTGSAVENYNTSAGTLSVALYSVDATGNAVYPTASAIYVLQGGIQNNTPANPGIAVSVQTGGAAGSVAVVSTTDGCQGYLSGDVDLLNSSFVGPGGGNADNLWAAWLSMAENAPDICQGDTININVTVNVET